MGVSGSDSHGRTGLTPRQQKWFASVKASLERDTGRSMDEWVEIARSCPETKPKAQVGWLHENYGLGVNRAAQILSAAFRSRGSWDDDPDKLRARLWTDRDAAAIFQAVEKLALALPDTIVGQRKAFTAFSHEFQFASIKPVKGGKAILGLALTPDADSRLQEPKNEGWSERLKSKLLLESPHQVDASVAALLKAARDRS